MFFSRDVRRQAIARSYLLRIRQMRLEMQRRLEVAYRASIREDAIAASFEDRFVPQATRIIAASHSGAGTLTRAYLRAIGGVFPGSFLPTKSEVIAATLIGIVPVILARIRDGAAPEEALTIGAAYVSRTADNEFSGVVDREMERQAKSGAFVGWIGHSYNSKDDCVNNDGFHTFETKPYRHPSCKCDLELVPFQSASL